MNINKIDIFEGEYRFLSNFYPVDVKYEGKKFPSVEHAYQAAKTKVPEEISKIRTCGTPFMAKKLGKKVTLRKDWESIKVQVMTDLVRQKFQIQFFKDLLLATNELKIEEGNTWGDTFWGVCGGKGKNFLGKILMDIRKELQEDSNRA